MSQGDAIVSTDQECVTLLTDAFTDDVALGKVVGGVGPFGARRTGVDAEGRIGADNGALRIKPLTRPGWGREGLAYGPFEREPGLVMGVHLLNGHHASQTFVHHQTPRQRIRAVAKSVLSLKRPVGRHHENLAVGFFESPGPKDPIRAGHGLVMHSATADNGELWAGVAGSPLRVVRGVRNLPLAVYVALRAQGAVYYVATVPEDPDLPALPWVRPVALDHSGNAPVLYPGVHQRILGEVGYRVDSRVWQVGVARVPALADWCGGASLADRLTGDGDLAGSAADRGGRWRSWEGSATRTATGVLAPEAGTFVLEGESPAGLVHARITTGPRPRLVGLVWRASTEDRSCWRLLAGPDGVELAVLGPQGVEVVATASAPGLRPGSTHSLQVLDDGQVFSLHLDGTLLFDRWFDDGRLAGGVGAGLTVAAGDHPTTFGDFEAHPRLMRAPFLDEPTWPQLPDFGPPVFDEKFDAVGADLHDVTTPSGARPWRRIEGAGRLVLEGRAGARVDADPSRPNPGRTIYGVDWECPEGVDVSVTATPPGSRRGERHNGRSGLVLWQDEQNYLVVNVWLDDWLVGTSVSTFYRIRGHEDMYDAVWTLTGEKVTWGVSHTLRVAFDGERFVAYLDDRPMLYRAIRDVYPDAPRLSVNRIAVIANEEWGDDTGTLFQRVVASPPIDRLRGSQP